MIPLFFLLPLLMCVDVFLGRDASRAFVTGDFTEAGLTDDVSDLSPSQIVALYDWLAFYQKDYTPVGKIPFELVRKKLGREA